MLLHSIHKTPGLTHLWHPRSLTTLCGTPCALRDGGGAVLLAPWRHWIRANCPRCRAIERTWRQQADEARPQTITNRFGRVMHISRPGEFVTRCGRQYAEWLPPDWGPAASPPPSYWVGWTAEVDRYPGRPLCKRCQAAR
jgi:hypothetical protein